MFSIRIRSWRLAALTALAAGGCLVAPTFGTVRAAAYRSVTDQAGRQVRLPVVVKRIVTLAPSLTEMVFFLGQGQKLVAATRFSTFPAPARNLPRVGSYIRINVEAVAMLKPDLVLGLQEVNPDNILDQMTRLGLPVYRIRLRSVADILVAMRRLGKMIGAGRSAAFKVDRLAGRVARVRRMVSGRRRVSVFIEIDHRPLVTVGPGTFTARLIDLAGGRNAFGKQRFSYPRLSTEQVLLARPEVIVILCHNRRRCATRVRFWRRWPSIPAVRRGRIHVLNTDLLVRPSQRLVDGLEALARVLHPRAMGATR
ncbi:MAG: cobalamin-binding protein [Proteobacteria bacterium]|nr:cobalamin-binding protein [Pseudomonadota bacterium]